MLNAYLYHCLPLLETNAVQFLSFIFKQSNIVSHHALHLLLQCGSETVLLLPSLKFNKQFLYFFISSAHMCNDNFLLLFSTHELFYYQGQSITLAQTTYLLVMTMQLRNCFLLPIHKVLF